MSNAFTIATAIILIYLLWAIWHHRKDKSLTLSIFIEYLLTALLSIILLVGVSL